MYYWKRCIQNADGLQTNDVIAQMSGRITTHITVLKRRGTATLPIS